MLRAGTAVGKSPHTSPTGHAHIVLNITVDDAVALVIERRLTAGLYLSVDARQSQTQRYTLNNDKQEVIDT